MALPVNESSWGSNVDAAVSTLRPARTGLKWSGFDGNAATREYGRTNNNENARFKLSLEGGMSSLVRQSGGLLKDSQSLCYGMPSYGSCIRYDDLSLELCYHATWPPCINIMMTILLSCTTAEKSSEGAQICLVLTAYLLIFGSQRPMKVDRYKVWMYLINSWPAVWFRNICKGSKPAWATDQTQQRGRGIKPSPGNKWKDPRQIKRFRVI